MIIYVDADACPVKAEVYRVAQRYELPVKLVSNTWMRVPDEGDISLIIVEDNPDAADDWIAEAAGAGDIVITADIPLADRALRRGARALSPRGRIFDDDSIGEALATRDLLAHLRETGTMTGGPPPFAKRDRSQFLRRLDETIHAIRRERGGPHSGPAPG